ncbi:MAG: triosephosphate isomerase [halophilic archaeon J07HX5]|jgi:triosephosphate isomerase (EC 5.3.1.1)|nr:MAG: triosephosphate isomerase [halophilic archaeon J07HX5]
MFVLVNLKAYAVDPAEIARAAAAVSTADVSVDVRLAVAPQAAHIERVAATDIEAWAQHVAPIDQGSHTGHVRAEAVADAGAVGTLLNHSERRLQLGAIETSLAAAERAGLETVVCAATPAQAGAVAALGPDAVAIEPPALIGTDTPVSQADPGVVTEAAAAVETAAPGTPVYCGAGISTGADVRAAYELGADGVVLASGVTEATDPQATLAQLVAEL